MYFVIHNRRNAEIHVYHSDERVGNVRTWCGEQGLDLIACSQQPFDASIPVLPLNLLLVTADDVSTSQVAAGDATQSGLKRRILKKLLPRLVKFDVGEGTCEGNAYASSVQTLLEYGYTPLMMDGLSCYCLPPDCGVQQEDASPQWQALQGQCYTDKSVK